MARFIKETERKKITEKVQQKSYALRKFIISAEIVLLFGFIIMTFVSLGKNLYWFDNNNSLTTLGIGMLIWAIVVSIFGLISLILTFTLKSPKTTVKTIEIKEKAPVSGRRISQKD